MQDAPRLNIIIIGAGLGGFAAAISCALGGHNVTVLEKTTASAEIGAGLQITPNCSRLLQAWGLCPALEKCWSEPTLFSIQRYSDGKLFHSTQDWHIKMRERYGAPFIDVHRGQLQKLMYDRAVELGVHVQLGVAVQSVDRDTAEITLATGETCRGDLVVGADGLWSTCRQSLLPQPPIPQPTGDLAYRIVLELDQITDPELRDWIQKPACRLWVGPRSHVVAYSMRSGTMYNIVLLVPDDLPSHVSKQKGDVNEMKALFQGWDPILTRFLDQVDSVQKWKLMHLPELETWTNPQGNFLLLGDSCHPMLPYMAQGAASAIEDGAVLGLLLGKVNSRSQMPRALEMWQTMRKERSEFIARQALAQRTLFHLPDGPQQRERDDHFKQYLDKEPKAGYPSLWVDPEIQRYIFGYDAFAEVEAALAKPEVLSEVTREISSSHLSW